MRLTLAAVGKLKDGPERELFDRYWERLGALGRRISLSPCTLSEIPESRAASAASRSDDEASRLVAKLGEGRIVLLDERGKNLSSEIFAALIRRHRDAGLAGLAFVIGGPDGHGRLLRERAADVVSLGALTLPHGLARVVLAEQLYRAATIIAGHPYHRN